MSDSASSFARNFAETSLARERSVAKLDSVVRKLHLIADADVARTQRAQSPACHKGCDACCYRIVPVSVPEAIRIASLIPVEQRGSVLARIDRYREATAQFRGGDTSKARVACPLLVDGLCSVYEARPLFCRGMNALDVLDCTAWKAGSEGPIPRVPGQMAAARSVASGFGSALTKSQLQGDMVDLGLALGVLLSDPGAAESYASGKAAFEGAALPNFLWPADEGQATTRDAPKEWPPTSPAPRALAGDPPSETGPRDRILADFERLAAGEARYEEAIALLEGSNDLRHMIQRIWAPYTYSSEQDIDRWREHFRQAVDDFEHCGFDPGEACAALSGASTFSVPYQGRAVRPLMEPFGRLVCDRIASRAIPDLVEPIERKRRPGKIRVGYASCLMLSSHSSKWALGWAANQADDIETYALNIGPAADSFTDRWERTVDHYYHLPGRVPAAARFIKDLDLDVLVYTDVGILGRGYQFAALRLARVQCTGWGLAATSGLPTIDYYLSSDLMEPPGAEDHYSEKLVRLPGSGLCYERPNVVESEKTRAEFGLPADGPFVLMAQGTMKCLPKWDYIYGEISARLGRPVAFLERTLATGDNRKLWGIVNHTKRRLAAAGVNMAWIPAADDPRDYFRLMGLADVSIDSPGWSGGNTTIEALLMGTPVVTLPGEFMRGNHSVAFLQIAGAPGLIAKDPEDYVDLVCDSERQREAMKNLNADALFGDLRPVRALDEFYRRVAGGG
ncbi:MAG: YkgJ family cysteine cluster protein [Fimbriimonas ginsengisoli]|uniref:YkgJ family cysteine cluster protein n=1 Tax=Fimbriimonas ginsengisoli TaxID=1005039 RepID=A0A931LYC5_FIMGI|nr:YkgJ family cysteine cluster protein [Fimbriimonas ginsengisoli]